MTAYHTLVTSFVAVAAVVLIVFGDPFAGTPAHVDALDVLFVSAVYAVAPNPPTFTTLYPQVFAPSAVGAACVPVFAGIVLPPLTRLVLASVSAIVRLYPALLFVLTVIVSLELVTAPPAVGVTFNPTVVLVLTLIVAATVAVIVEEPVEVAA